MPLETDMLEIKHLAETVVYRVSNVQCAIDAGRLNVEVETTPIEGGPFSHLSNPTLFIENATVHVDSLSAIEHEKIDVETGWDTDEQQKSDNIFRININQHLALNNNHLIVRRTTSSEIEIEWRCTCQNILDFRDTDNELKLSCSVAINPTQIAT